MHLQVYRMEMSTESIATIVFPFKQLNEPNSTPVVLCKTTITYFSDGESHELITYMSQPEYNKLKETLGLRDL